MRFISPTVCSHSWVIELQFQMFLQDEENVIVLKPMSSYRCYMETWTLMCKFTENELFSIFMEDFKKLATTYHTILFLWRNHIGHIHSNILCLEWIFKHSYWILKVLKLLFTVEWEARSKKKFKISPFEFWISIQNNDKSVFQRMVLEDLRRSMSLRFGDPLAQYVKAEGMYEKCFFETTKNDLTSRPIFHFCAKLELWKWGQGQ